MAPLKNYQDLLETSPRVTWRLEDLIGEGRRVANINSLRCTQPIDISILFVELENPFTPTQ